MTTSSDLVEAHTFRRRRLTTAFVSGATGAWHDAERRALRAVVGGVALAVLVVAGAVIARVLAPRPPGDWERPGLLLSEDTGQAFVILPEDDRAAPELRPVANLTSARLLLGPDVEPTVLPESTLEKQPVGPDVGIPGAPASVPAPSSLIQTGWTACPSSRGVRVRLGADPAGPVVDEGQVVAVGRAFYLVVNVPVDDERQAAHALPLPDDVGVDNLLSALGLPSRVVAPRVPRAWLDLVPQGAPLSWQSFGLVDVGGRPVQWDSAGVPVRARIGDVLVDPAGAAVVLTRRGPADLDPFAAAVYTHVRMPDGGEPDVLPVRRLPDLARTALPGNDLHWPTRPPDPIGVDPCAVLTTAGDDPPRVALVRATAPDRGSDAGVGVEPGRGAVVRDVRPGRDPVPVLVDGTGRAHVLEDDALTQLGYADVVLPAVPHAWVRLLDRGVPLSRARALCSGRPSC